MLLRPVRASQKTFERIFCNFFFFQFWNIIVIYFTHSHPRLSTIKNADKIAVVKRGRVVEVGNHKTLTEKKGLYYDLLTAHQTDGDRLAL